MTEPDRPAATGRAAARARALRTALKSGRASRRMLFPDPRWTAWPTLGAVFLVFAAAMAFADPWGFSALRTWPPAMVAFLARITNLGLSGYYLVPLGIVLIALGLWAPQAPERVEAAIRTLWLRIAFVFFAVAGTGLTSTVLKHIIARARPFHVGEGRIWEFHVFSMKASLASFPSGHATTIVTLAAALTLLAPARRRWAAGLAFGLVALVICASRVVIGAHFVSDVVAGAVLGAGGTLAFAAFLLRHGLVFRQTIDGALALRGAGASKTLRAWIAGRS